MIGLLQSLLWLGCGLAAVPALMIARNLRALRPPRAPARGACDDALFVSILIPARNEREHIAAAVAAALASRHPRFEVIVLDDDSADGTAEVVATASERDARLRLLRGRPLPAGARGKPFACQQLAEAARGELLLFVDADVRLAPDAAARLEAELLAGRAALLSGVPAQRTESWSEKLLVPLIHFVLLGYLPIALMRRDGAPALGAACGQVVLAKREAYFAAGGHTAVAGCTHDGLALARRLREAGFITDLTDLTDVATCRMYRNWRSVVGGLAKSAHEGLGSRRGLVPWSVLLLGGQTLPAAALPWVLGSPSLLAPAAAGAVLACAGRFALAVRFRQSPLGAALHPLGVAGLVAIQWYAVLRRAFGRPVAWKGRLV